MVTAKQKFATRVVIDLMKIGGIPKRSGCHMKSTRYKSMKILDKSVEVFTKKNKHHLRRRWILSRYCIGLWKPLKKRHDDTNADVMNHQASIKNIETQLGQLRTLVNERLPP